MRRVATAPSEDNSAKLISDADDSASPGISRSVARALAILTDVAGSDTSRSFVDLQQCHKLPKATLHKLLFTLETLGFLNRSPDTGRYSMGLAAFGLTMGASRSGDVRSIVSPILRALVEKCNETGNVGVLDGTDEIILERIDPPKQVLRLAFGRKHPAYGSSSGLAALAVPRGAAAIAALPESLPPLTQNTVKTREALLTRLADVRAKGYALDLEEVYPGVRCIGVAIDVPGWPVATMSLSLPLQRATMDRLRSLAKPLIEAAAQAKMILALTPRP